MRLGPLVLLALLAVPLAAAGPGGGQVANVAPVVEVLRRDGTAAQGSADVVTGLVRDGNGVGDLARLELRVDGRGPAASNRTLEGAAVPAVEPEDFGPDGWKLWRHAASNGSVAFRFRHVYAAPGNHTWTLVSWDVAGGSAASAFTVQVARRSSGGGGGGGGDPGAGSGISGGGEAGGPGADGGAGGEGAGAAGPAGGEGGTGEAGGDTSASRSRGNVFDITEGLRAERDGDGVALRWEAVPEADGYQVWRHDDGAWVLVADVPGDAPSAMDAGSPSGARYKVTYYLQDGSGRVDSRSVGLLSGWDPALYREALGEVRPERHLLVWLFAAALGALFLLLLLLRRRRRDEDEGKGPAQ